MVYADDADVGHVIKSVAQHKRHLRIHSDNIVSFVDEVGDNPLSVDGRRMLNELLFKQGYSYRSATNGYVWLEFNQPGDNPRAPPELGTTWEQLSNQASTTYTTA